MNDKVRKYKVIATIEMEMSVPEKDIPQCIEDVKTKPRDSAEHVMKNLGIVELTPGNFDQLAQVAIQMSLKDVLKDVVSKEAQKVFIRVKATAKGNSLSNPKVAADE